MVLLILIGERDAPVSIVAEFATSDACWEAVRQIERPLDDPPFLATTMATCVAKGQKAYGQ